LVAVFQPAMAVTRDCHQITAWEPAVVMQR
jgi:hypothetical protein